MDNNAKIIRCTATQIGSVTVDLAGLVRVRQQLDLARRVGLIKD
jgi:hypothetical protein